MPGKNRDSLEFLCFSMSCAGACWHKCVHGAAAAIVLLVPLLNGDFSLQIAPGTVFQKLMTCVPYPLESALNNSSSRLKNKNINPNLVDLI